MPKMRIAVVERRKGGKTYRSFLLRQSCRDGSGKSQKRTLANLSSLPEDAVAVLDAHLKGRVLAPADESFEILESRSHGAVLAAREGVRPPRRRRAPRLPEKPRARRRLRHDRGPDHPAAPEARHRPLVGGHHPAGRIRRPGGRRERSLRGHGLAARPPEAASRASWPGATSPTAASRFSTPARAGSREPPARSPASATAATARGGSRKSISARPATSKDGRRPSASCRATPATPRSCCRRWSACAAASGSGASPSSATAA